MSKMDRRMFVAGAGSLVAATVSQVGSMAAQQGAASPNMPAVTTDPHALLNLRFRDLYKANRDELLSVTALTALTLIGTGEVWRLEFGVPVRSYTPLPWIAQAKGIMHGVIATQATASRLVRSKDPKTVQTDVVRLAESLANAETLIAASLPPDVAASSKLVIGRLRRLADDWVKGVPATLESFALALQEVRPDLDRVITLVGEAIYESVVKGLRQLIAESDPKEWERSLFGVCGVGFARRDNIEIAAAMSVMGRDAVGTRLLYLENAFTIADGAKLIAASLADLELGRDVFDDQYRMWRDLMGDVAVKHAKGGFFPETGRSK